MENQHRVQVATLWDEVVRRLESGEKQATIAKELGLTLGQFRYRLRKFNHANAGLSQADWVDGAEQPVLDRTLLDDSFERNWPLNRLVLMVKEPTCVFAYWYADEIRKNLVCGHFQSAWSQLPFFLQLYDVTDIHFNGDNAHSVRQIRVYPESDNWYIHHVEPRRRYMVDFGTTTLAGRFFTILRSNIVETPPDPHYRQYESYVQFGSRYSHQAIPSPESVDGYIVTTSK